MIIFRPKQFNSLLELREQYRNFLKENEGKVPTVMEITVTQNRIFQSLAIKQMPNAQSWKTWDGMEIKIIHEECTHEDCKIVGAIANTHLCFKCHGELVANEIYINYEYVEVGGFCNNEKCERFLLLVV